MSKLKTPNDFTLMPEKIVVTLPDEDICSYQHARGFGLKGVYNGRNVNKFCNAETAKKFKKCAAPKKSKSKSKSKSRKRKVKATTKKSKSTASKTRTRKASKKSSKKKSSKKKSSKKKSSKKKSSKKKSSKTKSRKYKKPSKKKSRKLNTRKGGSGTNDSTDALNNYSASLDLASLF